MKKITAAFIAMLVVLTAAGCGGNTTPAQTSDTSGATAGKPAVTTDELGAQIITTVDENGNNSLIMEAPEREDTTAQALVYLEEKAPAFKRYLDMRRSIPVSFESTVTQNGKEWKTGFYIKDDSHMALYSVDPDGARIDVVYDADKIYQVEHARKTVFTYSCGEEQVKEGISETRLSKIYYNDVMESSYYCDNSEYEGTVYDRVIITTGEDQIQHFFDIDTGKLAYTIVGDNVTRVDTLENSITNEDIFNIPTDYEQKKYADLVEEQLAAEKAAAQSAAAEKAAEESKAAAEG